MMSEKAGQELQLSRTLLCLYDAVGDPIAWESALDSLVEASGCVSALLTVGDRAPSADGVMSPYEINAGSQVFRDNSETLAEYFRLFGQREIEEFAFFRDAPPLQIQDDSLLYPDIAKFKEREDFRYRREKLEFYRRFGARLNDNRRWAEAAFFQLGLEHEEIPAPIRDCVASYLPHVAKVVELGRTFAELRRRYRAMFGVLDKVRVGLGLVRSDGSVILTNEEARRVLDQGKGLSLSRDGRLAIDDKSVAASVSRAIVGAVRTASGMHDIADFRIKVENGSVSGNGTKETTGGGIILEVAPIRDSLGELGEPEQHALLTLIDPSETVYISIERLILAYDLSVAEGDVCRLLVEGRTQVEIAEIRNVSTETVKTQTRSVFAKTGTRSRVEFVVLALRTAPPIVS